MDRLKKQYPTYANKNIILEDCEHFKDKSTYTEIKWGYWIDLNITEWQCSECNYRVERWNNTPYCPNCGTIMKFK